MCLTVKTHQRQIWLAPTHALGWFYCFYLSYISKSCSYAGSFFPKKIFFNLFYLTFNNMIAVGNKSWWRILIFIVKVAVLLIQKLWKWLCVWYKDSACGCVELLEVRCSRGVCVHHLVQILQFTFLLAIQDTVLLSDILLYFPVNTSHVSWTLLSTQIGYTFTCL